MSAADSEESIHQLKLNEEKAEDFPFTFDQEKSENEECDESDSKIQILVELGKNDLRAFTLSDCYATDRPGMQLEILPKIIFDTFDEEFPDDNIGMSKPISRLTVDQGTQASVKYKSSIAQTFKRRLVNSWSQYEPRLFSEEEKNEHLSKSSFQSFLESTEDKILSSLTQNKIADVFVSELESLCCHDKISHKKELRLKINGSFTVPEKSGKDVMISSIIWHSTYKDIFVASSMRVSSFEKRICDLLEPQNSSTLFYMWSVKNQFMPQLILECFDDICILKANPSLPDVLVGGTLTGHLVLWDIKNKFSLKDLDSKKRNIFYSNKFASPEIIPCSASSSVDHLHTFGITYLQWIPAHFEVTLNGLVHKNSHDVSYQIATCGLNGLLQFWDLRLGFAHKINVTAPKKFTHLDGVWEPFHTIQVLPLKGNNNKSLTCFSFRENIDREEGNILEEINSNDLFEKEPNLHGNGDNYADFFAGCDDGAILCGNFKLVRDDEGKYVAKIPNFYESPHNSSVSFITSSPFIKDVFMSGGGKSFAIWKHESTVSPILLRERASKITSGEWSPTKPALFILGLNDGSIEIWDLLINIYEPRIIFYVSTSAVKCLSIQKITEMEHIVAVGDLSGVVYTVSLPSSFWQVGDNELNQVKEYVEKETYRITGENAEPEESVPFEKTSNREPKYNENETDEEMNKAYNEFLELQEQELSLLNFSSKEIKPELCS